MLKADCITVRMGEKTLLEDISFEADDHEIVMVAGPNGAGKSTLVKAILQNVRHSGSVFLDGRNLAEIAPKERAKLIGVLPQAHAELFPFTAGEVVALGRYAYRSGLFSGADREDRERIDGAMRLTDTAALRDRPVTTLSGGELQRVFLASVFAQDPKLLILDEPTNSLDLNYQAELFGLLTDWVRGGERMVLAVMHDLSLVRAYGTRVLLMDRGRRYAFGKEEEVLSRENLRSVYRMDVAEWMRGLLRQWE